MWPWYRCWYPWGLGWHRRRWIPPYAWPWPSIPVEDEKAMLEDQARMLEHELKSIRQRLEELNEKEVKNA
jgi:hypothetical protein